MKNSILILFFFVLFFLTECKTPEEVTVTPNNYTTCHVKEYDCTTDDSGGEVCSYKYFYYCFYKIWNAEFSISDSTFNSTLEIEGSGDEGILNMTFGENTFSAFSEEDFFSIVNFTGNIILFDKTYAIINGAGFKENELISMKIRLVNNLDSVTLFINTID